MPTMGVVVAGMARMCMVLICIPADEAVERVAILRVVVRASAMLSTLRTLSKPYVPCC